MVPTYEELIVLNPLLKRKSKEEVNELLETITSCGYIWDNTRKVFFNQLTSNSIRTQGLDLFNSELFKELQNDLLDELKSDPHIYHREGQTFYYLRKFSPKIILLLLLNLAIGWLILSSQIWWIINISLLFIIIFLFSLHNHYAKKKEELRKKGGKYE